MSTLFAEFADVERKRTAAMQRILQRYAALLQRNQGGFDVPVKEVRAALAWVANAAGRRVSHVRVLTVGCHLAPAGLVQGLRGRATSEGAVVAFPRVLWHVC